MKIKVTNEYYRIARAHYAAGESIEYEVLKIYDKYTQDMYWDALLISAQNRELIGVQRITEGIIESGLTMWDAWDEVFNNTGLKVGDKVKGITGKSDPGKIPHFASDLLGRYHPNNGWSIPEFAEIEEDI